jgi:hypothetical protein
MRGRIGGERLLAFELRQESESPAHAASKAARDAIDVCP